MFDFDRWKATRTPWVLTIDGREYVAKPVSTEAVLRFLADVRGAPDKSIWPATLRLLRLAFPRRPSYWWRGDPVQRFAEIAREYPQAAQDAVKDFFPLLTGAPTSAFPNGTPTRGTPSPA